MLIAQISDFHLRADGALLHGCIDTEQALAAGVSHVNRLDPAPDLVLATGDLVDEALPEDYTLLRACLDRLAMPVFVIPGNHDDRERLRAAFADQQYVPRDGTFLHYTVEDRPLRLIGRDTVIPGEISGGMCSTRLAWLADRLAEQRDRPTLIFMHHPPFPTGTRFMDTPAFSGADDLQALIADHPQVRLVICGHIHRSIHIGWAGTVAATAPSTVNQMPLALNPGESFRVTADPPALSLYLWEGGAGVLSYTSLIEGGRPPAAASGS